MELQKHYTALYKVELVAKINVIVTAILVTPARCSDLAIDSVQQNDERLSC